MEGQTIQWTKKNNEPKHSKHYTTNTTDWTIQTLYYDNERKKKQNKHTHNGKKQHTNKQAKNNNKRKKTKKTKKQNKKKKTVLKEAVISS